MKIESALIYVLLKLLSDSNSKEYHFVEIGIGLSYGLYICKSHDQMGHQVEESRSGAFGFLDIGYRYYMCKGLFVRLGINPSLPLNKYDEDGRVERGVDRKTLVYPYFSLGYSF